MTTAEQAAIASRDRFAAALEHESQATLRVLKALPADRLAYKPHEKSWDMGKLAWHTAVTEEWFVKSIAAGSFGGEDNTPANLTHGDIVSYYEKAVPKNIAALKAMDAATLARVVDFFGVAKMPAVEFMSWCVSHTIHHRGQLTVYIRLTGGKVPSVYGPSADDNPFVPPQ